MQHVRSRRCLAAILGLGLAVASISPAAAQSGASSSPAKPGESEQNQAQYSEDDLKAFAVAALEVRRIREDYTPKVQKAETPQKREEISKEATDKMVEAVEKHGLSPEKYNNIYAASQSDPGLADRVNKHLRDVQ